MARACELNVPLPTWNNADCDFDGDDANWGPVALDDALERSFGSTAPSRGPLAGAGLIGVPAYQLRVMLLCGCGKCALAMPIFLPLFTHTPYEPLSCEDPVEKWKAPSLGSIAYEWRLACDREWLLAQVDSIFFVGAVFGVIIGGFLTDRYGRRWIAVNCCALTALLTLASAVAPTLRSYLVLRFFLGATDLAMISALFLLALEWLPRGWKSSIGGYLFSCAALGQLLLAAISLSTAALTQGSWRALTFLSGLFILCTFILQYWFLPESPRWLHSSGQHDAAVALLSRAARRNELSESSKGRKAAYKQVADEMEEGGLLDSQRGLLVPGPALPKEQMLLQVLGQKSTWVMAFMWFAASLAYYGISFSTSEFSHTNIYPATVLSAACEIPAALLSAYLLENAQFGRQRSTVLLYLAGGCALAAVPLAAPDYEISMAVISKFFICAAFDGMNVYASEVFDTAVVGTAIGFCSMAARLASIGAPEVVVMLRKEQALLAVGVLVVLASGLCHVFLSEVAKEHPDPSLTSESKPLMPVYTKMRRLEAERFH